MFPTGPKLQSAGADRNRRRIIAQAAMVKFEVDQDDFTKIVESAHGLAHFAPAYLAEQHMVLRGDDPIFKGFPDKKPDPARRPTRGVALLDHFE